MASRQDDYEGRATQGPGLMGTVAGLALHQARRLPHFAVRLPMLSAGFALVTLETLRQQARVHGTGVRTLLSPDALRTAVKAGLDTVLPLAEDHEIKAEAQKIAETARETGERAVSEARTEARKSAAAVAAASPAAREVGAPGTATPAADRAAERTGTGDVPSREDLAIGDFDNATLASLRARLRPLSVEQLVQLREYERAHAHRLPVITMLENRIAKLEAETDRGAAQGEQGEQGASAQQAEQGALVQQGEPGEQTGEPGEQTAEAQEVAQQAAAELDATVRP